MGKGCLIIREPVTTLSSSLKADGTPTEADRLIFFASYCAPSTNQHADCLNQANTAVYREVWKHA